MSYVLYMLTTEGTSRGPDIVHDTISRTSFDIDSEGFIVCLDKMAVINFHPLHAAGNGGASKGWK